MSQQSNSAPSPATQPPQQAQQPYMPQPPRGPGGPGGPGGFPFGAAMRHLQQAIESLHAHKASLSDDAAAGGAALALPGADPLDETSAHLDTVARFLRGLNPYLNQVSTDPPKLLDGVLDETYTHDWRGAYEQGQMEFPMMAGGCAGTYEGGFIAQVAGTLRAKRVLEIGMFTGSTTLQVAHQIPDDGKVIALEVSSYLRDLAVGHFARAGLGHKIEVRVAPALQSLKAMVASGEPGFDLIFIDADKPGYLDYYRTIMDGGLLNEYGVILCDNVLQGGSVVLPELQMPRPPNHPAGSGGGRPNGQVMRQFNEFIKADDRVDVTVLPVRDGISWVTKKRRFDVERTHHR